MLDPGRKVHSPAPVPFDSLWSQNAMVQKIHFLAWTELLVPIVLARNTVSCRKQMYLIGFYFRHGFRLVFPVLPVENLYLRTGRFCLKGK
jgi:hypothetical protein